ncbi:MAG TPA: 3-hydroxyacyl-CoA dehydrogenase NAD-binding domain-containing protein, partial [Sporosarcina sp.]|nr:3-hydroxyacyl-CoA dehydrogenase NAD-binding domain-containing protein [Sporosarcina sp.]
MIQRIVMVGSGVMGRGIAYVGAVGGYSVTLVDINEMALQHAKDEIEAIFEKGMKYGKISADTAENARQKLTYETKLAEAAGRADLIIEAVPELASIKQQVFEELEQYASKECYFATNTSTMSPTEIASFGKRPDKTIAMHFFNPVHKMPLVEIVRGLETSDGTVE